jgi:3,4-dihydroxy-2-butanone 4-phosphate synthase
MPGCRIEFAPACAGPRSRSAAHGGRWRCQREQSRTATLEHLFPVRAQPGGVLTRHGHAEGTVDLMQLARLHPAGVLCELTNPDGTLARLSQVMGFAARHDMPVLSLEDLVTCRTTVLGHAV